MNIGGQLALGLLGAGALPALIRLVRGPSVFDRMVAADMLAVLLVSGIVVSAALTGRSDYMVVVVVVALLLFISTVVSAQLAQWRTREDE